VSEKEQITQVEKKKTYHPWKHYFRWGMTAFLTVAACITFFFILYRWGTISAVIGKILKSAESIIIGLALAYLLMPIKNYIEKRMYKMLLSKKLKPEKAKKLAKTLGITGAIIFLFVILGILIMSLGPALVTSVIGLIDAMPSYVESFVKWISDSGLADTEVAIFIGHSINALTAEVENWAKTEILPMAQQYISQITSGVFSVLKTIFNFLIGIVAMTYVMSIDENLIGQCKKIIYATFPTHEGNLIIETIRKSHKIFGGFVIGKIIDSAIIGVIAYIGCLLFKMPSALLVAFIIGVTNVIPFFGPFIGAVPSVALVLIQSPIHALYLVIFILILQQVDGNIIGPKILGESTGLSAFWILTSISIAGGLFGFFGMLLGVPVFAVIYYILQQIIAYRMKSRDLSSDTEEYVELVKIDEKTKEMKYEKEA